MDITEVTRRSGAPASTLRFYEEKGLIASIGRRGLRRLFDPGVLERLALIALARSAGFTLDEIAGMFGPNGRPRIDRQMLAARADELDRTIRRLSAMRRSLRHAAACPAPSHMECPTFRRLLRAAASGGVAGATKVRGRSHLAAWRRSERAPLLVIAEEGRQTMAEHQSGREYGGNPAANYERFFVPAIGAPLATDLVRLAALRPGERVLDVACGTGVVARLASGQVGATGSVAGLDVNPGMLAVARSATPPGIPVEWHEASAEAMPLADASFDVVMCQMGLQFMPDRHAALHEMRRVLVRGGRLILNLPGPTPRLFTIMGEALARHIGDEAARFVNRVFSLHDTSEIQNLVSGAGFQDVSVQADTRSLRLPAPEEFLWQYLHSTPLAGAVAQVDDERRGLLERDVVARWQEFVKDGALELQARIVAATGRK